MKALLRLTPTILLGMAGLQAAHARNPVIAGPWTVLRKAPLFESETLPLAKTWGSTLPVGGAFEVEKVYGRWLYGKPAPLSRMKPSDYAKPGWVFSRMLLLPRDSDTQSSAQLKQSKAVLFHANKVWADLGLGGPPLRSSLEFLESLVLSENTLKAFTAQDEASLSQWLEFIPDIFPRILTGAFSLANAAEEESDVAPMGLTGTDLSFLEQEFQVMQKKKEEERRAQMARILKAPPSPTLTNDVKIGILGRYMLEKYLELPPLTHEEVDGFIYMRAAAMRALRGCPKPVQDYWKNRRWNLFRVYRFKSRPEIKHPWLEVALPGGYFGISGKAIDLAGNEAELAFLLVRPLVREMRIQRKKIVLNQKNWPQSLEAVSEENWSEVLKSQSTKDSKNLDVADEIAVDITAIECISRGGYRPMGGLSYLRKLSVKSEEPWAEWFFEHSIGLEYRLERLVALMEEGLSKRKFPEGKASNIKRFSTAARHWNLMP